jgi:hypothetical protein
MASPRLRKRLYPSTTSPKRKQCTYVLIVDLMILIWKMLFWSRAHMSSLSRPFNPAKIQGELLYSMSYTLFLQYCNRAMARTCRSNQCGRCRFLPSSSVLDCTAPTTSSKIHLLQPAISPSLNDGCFFLELCPKLRKSHGLCCARFLPDSVVFLDSGTGAHDPACPSFPASRGRSLLHSGGWSARIRRSSRPTMFYVGDSDQCGQRSGRPPVTVFYVCFNLRRLSDAGIRRHGLRRAGMWPAAASIGESYARLYGGEDVIVSSFLYSWYRSGMRAGEITPFISQQPKLIEFYTIHVRITDFPFRCIPWQNQAAHHPMPH